MPSPKSPQEMFRAMRANIEQKTGKSFEAWVQLARKAGLGKFKALTDHMKKNHGLTHGYAQMVAWGVLDPGRLEVGNQDQNLVDELYAGKREGLRPIHDRLIDAGAGLGPGVETVICKTYTSLRSKSQFAIAAPRTLRAVDLELALPADFGAAPPLEPFKSSNPKFTYRIRITEPSDVDAAVTAALKAARAYVDGGRATESLE